MAANHPLRGTVVQAIVAATVVLAGCGSDSTPRSNLPPSAQLTHGPVEGGEASYAIRVAWTGADPDGYVAHYEIAVDPPAAFTETEIAAGGPGLTEAFTEDSVTGVPLRRVSKVVDGETVSFDWEMTADFSRRFWFSTPRADSSEVDGKRVPLPRYSGTHGLYVRAVDDDGAVSTPDRVAFTATTVTPSTFLTRPFLKSLSPLRVGATTRIEWSGVDPDAPGDRNRPAAYEYKMVLLRDLYPPIGIIPTPDPNFILHTAAAAIPWVRVPPESSWVTFELIPGASYMFGVRAVDTAQAMDPFLVYPSETGPGNVVLLYSLTTAGFPDLTLYESGKRRGTYRKFGNPEFEYFAEMPLDFSWTATAQEYGALIDGYRYAVNPVNPEQEGPGGGWSEWSTLTHPTEPILFRAPGLFYVQARDDLGATTTIEVLMSPVDAPHDRDILIVDDAKDGVFPRDSERDAFWNEIMVNSGRFSGNDLDPTFYRWDSHGPNDTFYLNPNVPGLADLGRYRLVLYDCSGGAGFGGSTGLVEAGPRRGYLGGHLRSGGQLWITGTLTTAAMIPSVIGTGNFEYPHRIEPGMFPWEYMKLYSERIEATANERTDIHGMIRVEPFPGRPEVFPAMEVDFTKMRLEGFGVGDCDLIYDAIFQGAEPTFRGQIDSLYIYRAIGPTQPEPRSSTYDRRLNAIRWHDPDPNREHGRTMWFGFPVYHLKNDQFQETFNRAIDWFREERSGS